MIPKPGKSKTSVSRPLFSSLSKVLEKLTLNRVSSATTCNAGDNVIPDRQFGFHADHFPQYSNNIEERRGVSSALFLDIAQAFDKVWHPGLLYKLRKFLHPDFYAFFKSYQAERTFVVRINDSYSEGQNFIFGAAR